MYRFLGWCTFRTSLHSPVLRCKQVINSLAVAGIATPFVYPAPRNNPHGRLLSFFLGFGVCFVWLTIRTEGLFYIAYSLTLGLWVEVESALRPYTLAEDALQPITAAKAVETAEHAKDASTYRPHADDLRIAVFFLFFVQVAFFGTGK